MTCIIHAMQENEVTLDFAGNILMPDDGSISLQPTNPKSKSLSLALHITEHYSTLSHFSLPLSVSQSPSTVRHC